MNITKGDVQELRRRLKKTECTFGRLCGCYVNSGKQIVTKFTEQFSELEEDEYYKYLEIAKKTFSGTLGANLLELEFDRSNVFTYPGGKRNSGVEDASIVATHLMLAAANAGVDSCWLNFFDPDKLAQALGLPENEEILMILDLGFAAEGVTPLPNHSARKPLTETVRYL